MKKAEVKKLLKKASVSVLFAGIAGGVLADHTVVANLQCVRDAGMITTTWTVMDSTEKYGGDLEVEAGFTAHCSSDNKPGKVELKIHLYQDEAEIYSYSCDGSKDDSRCTGTAAEKDLEAAVVEAVSASAEALCKAAEQSLLSITRGQTVADVKVKHLQKGEKVEVQCQDNHHLQEAPEIQSDLDNKTDQHSH